MALERGKRHSYFSARQNVIAENIIKGAVEPEKPRLSKQLLMLISVVAPGNKPVTLQRERISEIAKTSQSH
ncbi:hypothetical protein Cylst_4157 [Cylindrospermum stagnale PCC 7417]|uniref:Uncharacterized protein n=1 Tax=Cylindrospermum stagnale PCC 7417 TaxID=56107 RepID=K9X2H9_9NOST|nr:hypothetical protein [Cylindrospermum stagnale]AFZ26261.1 hypothetical protein Cylst_4157 [Cylindrospermum stagnale PCC 7417]